MSHRTYALFSRKKDALVADSAVIAQLKQRIAKMQQRPTVSREAQNTNAPRVTYVDHHSADPARATEPLASCAEGVSLRRCDDFSRRDDIEDVTATHNIAPPSVQVLQQIALLAPNNSNDGTSALSELRASDILFFDTETTGLSRGAGTIAFMVGVGGFWGPKQSFEVHQFLIEKPHCETAALEQLQRYFARATLLVSYNGAAFDLPVLRNRSILNRTRLPLDLPHIDLLAVCRRHFKARLSDCRLPTVERELLNITREHDMPGSEAPQVYTDFLQDGRTERITRLLDHNLQDVASLAALLTVAAQHVGDPLHWAEDAVELHATGRYHLKNKRLLLGESCLQRALELCTDAAIECRVLRALARLYRRQKRHEEARDLWERYQRAFPSDATGWIELAKHHEHVEKDPARALHYVRRAPGAWTEPMQHRIARLEQRLERNGKKSAMLSP